MPERAVDPMQIHNFRTPALDLDSVYGDGPVAHPFMYQRADNRLFLIGQTKASGNTGGLPDIPASPNDLPRNVQGFALIGDPRNDENLVVAQTHLAFLKFHNKLVTTKNLSFEDARKAVTWHYQWIVLHDFVARLVGKDVLANALESRRVYQFTDEPFIPVEFAVAAYRFGHSMVRQSYDHNRIFGPGTGRLAPGSLNLLFRFTGLSGAIDGTPGNEVLPSNWVIDWRAFHEVGPLPAGRTFNQARLIDPFLVQELHTLPDKSSLPQRNLTRGVRQQLPSGQSVARAMRIDPLTPEEVAEGKAGAAAKEQRLTHQTPLWFYILQEAKIKGKGRKLGPVGGQIIAEVFVGLLEGDRTSFLAENPRWKPDLGPKPGVFSMADLLRFVDEINPVGD
jgi:hypothetical protein